MKLAIAILILGLSYQTLAVSKCESERLGLQNGMTRLGGYRPKCESDGRYHHTQCFGSVCFCVDQESGEKRSGTEGHISKIQDLENKCQTYTKRGTSKCESERLKQANGMTRLGGYRPKCESDGRYHHTQCFGSVCFCVDQESGEKRTGTEGHISKIQDLEKKCQTYSKRGISKCQQERSEANGSGLLGRFTPDCEVDGSYKNVQCREAVCYCANPETGRKIAGTETNVGYFGSMQNKCSGKVKRGSSKCEQARNAGLSSGLIGAPVPTCEEDGSYTRYQCRESVCYCADPETGEALEGTHAHISDYDSIKEQCTKGFNSLIQLTKCQKERMESNKSGLLGRFTPSCEADGSYKSVQCREAVCYCADSDTGHKIEGTEASIGLLGAMQSKCDGKSKRSAMSKCEHERNAGLSSGLIGAPVPTCEKDGSYSRYQCRESVCYCADPESGEAVEGTHGHISDYDSIKEQCTKGFTSLVQLTDCQKKRKTALESGLVGTFTPRCEDDGRYHHTQCHGSACFCVDRETGEKREGSEGHISDLDEVEGRCQTYAKRGLTTCTQQRDEARQSKLLGRFVPSCETDGSFSPVQCHEAVCFCVEPESGEQIANTERNIGGLRELQNDCTTNTPLAKRGSLSKCDQERQSALSSGLLGAFAPACESGKYARIQCHEAVCYCADPETGKAIDGSQGHVSSYDEIKQQCIAGAGQSLKFQSKCDQERQASLSSGLLGAFVPVCEDGQYARMQCRESVCYCADPETGHAIEGTQGHVSGYDEIKEQCTSMAAVQSLVQKPVVKDCKDTRTAYRWQKCDSGCRYFKGYGEALKVCCCD